MKFYICEHCGNIVVKVRDKKVPVFCCGQKMAELVPGTTDAATEKHVPVVEINGNKVLVKVGEVEHPMQDVHYIEWVIVETNKGYHKVDLNPGEKPAVEVLLAEGEEFVCAYEYCNLHGLWKSN